MPAEKAVAPSRSNPNPWAGRKNCTNLSRAGNTGGTPCGSRLSLRSPLSHVSTRRGGKRRKRGDVNMGGGEYLTTQPSPHPAHFRWLPWHCRFLPDWKWKCALGIAVVLAPDGAQPSLAGNVDAHRHPTNSAMGAEIAGPISWKRILTWRVGASLFRRTPPVAAASSHYAGTEPIPTSPLLWRTGQ